MVRIGSDDACKCTVLSLAESFEDCLAFPLVNSEIYGFPRDYVGTGRGPNSSGIGGTSRWSDWTTGRRRRSCDATAFMCVAGESVLDTNAVQHKASKWPERGVEHVPLDHIFAYFIIVRCHHGRGGGLEAMQEQFTAFIRASAQTKDSNLAEELRGEWLHRYLSLQTKRIKGLWKVQTAWSNTGHAAPSGNLSIEQLISFPIDASALERVKQRAPR